MKILTAIAMVLLLATVSQAQFVEDAPSQAVEQSTLSLGIQPVRSPFSLFDLSKISWSNSYSVSYFSGGMGSGSAGLWSTVMNYELSKSLSLAVNLSVSHNSGALWGDGSSDANFLPGFRLDFHPSEKFRMIVDFQRIDARSAFLANPYYSPIRPYYWPR